MANFKYNYIEQAFSVIKSKIVKTPLVTNDYINKLTENNVYFKLENLQITGSFKYRGALHKILKLSESSKKKGVIAYSSGNHAQAVAYASNQNNINAKIIMPNNAPKIKINNTKKYGAEVVLYDPNKEQRETIGQNIALEENRTLVKPYDDYDIIAGQGTVGLEIVDQLKEIKVVPNLYLCCCGGGGLIAGSSTYLKYAFPQISCYSVEPEGFEDTSRSLLSGKIESNTLGKKSICDALLAFQPGNLTFPINKKNLDGGLVVKEEETKKSIITIAENLKIIIEPGGAVAAAAILSKKLNIKNKNIVVMLSGGNIDPDIFSTLN
ncbi:MAG: pyridoxal-5'-phosphate-dependent protein [Rickettsiales bacterium]|nr:pyridoxal-5'-phosphate-dependent protein [Rickettsiales bacterium]|tara:strand:- start:1075 stop:2043 length:969 start_codon:yes stop_codon:yes gene_type:complete